MHAVIFAGGAVQPGEAVAAAIASADLVIAADSGAATALHYGYVPAIIVGDFDSLNTPALQQFQQQGSQLIQVLVEKNETDKETLYFGKPRGVSKELTQEQAEISLET